LSEAGKQDFLPSSYYAEDGTIKDCLNLTWNISGEFCGSYMEDHNTIPNAGVNRTAWVNKYTTTIYSSRENISCQSYEPQPIPDYLRWLRTGELHYLPVEERVELQGVWDDIPAAFLPEKILDLCFTVIQEPTNDLSQLIALLAWVTPSDAKQYLKKIEENLDNQKQVEREKERWKNHEMYKQNTKAQLESMCEFELLLRHSNISL